MYDRYLDSPERVRAHPSPSLARPTRPEAAAVCTRAQLLLLSSLALLVGFWLAGALSTVFGAAAFWEPIIGLGPMLVTEAVTRAYYSKPAERRTPTAKLLNACKVGFYFGITLDAMKLAN